MRVVRSQLRDPRWIVGFMLVVVGTGLTGCQPASPLERAGVVMRVPEDWRPVEATTWLVPGSPLAAWSGPEGSSLVVYRSMPVPGASAATLAESLGNRLINLPGYQVLERKAVDLAGQSVARVEVIAPGDGASFAPSGVGKAMPKEGQVLVPTHQVTVGIPRPDGQVYLTWHAKEDVFARIAPAVESTLQGLRFPAGSRSY